MSFLPRDLPPGSYLLSYRCKKQGSDEWLCHEESVVVREDGTTTAKGDHLTKGDMVYNVKLEQGGRATPLVLEPPKDLTPYYRRSHNRKRAY